MAMRANKSEKKTGTVKGLQPHVYAQTLEPRLLLSASAQNTAAQFLNTSSAVFVQNQGQWPDQSIKYAYNGQGINIGFTNTGPVLDLFQAKKPAPIKSSAKPAVARPTDPSPAPPELQTARISVSFDGAQPTAPVGIDRSPTSFNYLVGDASQHRSNVAGYEKISYPNLYKGIDLLTWAQPTGMKYEFHVAPGADWRNIQVTYSGANGMTLAPDGSLHIATPLGDLVEQAPVVYQLVNANRVEVAGNFVLVDADTYAFSVTGAYDPLRELIIDPDLAWATFLKGTFDVASGVAVDATGDVYVTGHTLLGGWATPGAYDAAFNGGFDAFVAKFNNSGTSLLFATYYGGKNSYVEGKAIAVDALGDAYITGVIGSAGLATTGAYDTMMGGSQDAFVAKFNATGSSLLYATYLGGSNGDEGDAIAVDAAGNAFVTGTTRSSEWTTPSAYDTTFNGPSDMFVAKLSASGSELVYATCLGSDGVDWGTGIAVDTSGNAYISGFTSSSGWATGGAYDTVLSGSFEAFAAKLNQSGSSLIYATYLGFAGESFGSAIAVDREGNAYVAGQTTTPGRATAGAYDEIYGGNTDGFVAKINALTSRSMAAETHI
jgi:hypothetical protein